MHTTLFFKHNTKFFGRFQSEGSRMRKKIKLITVFDRTSFYSSWDLCSFSMKACLLNENWNNVWGTRIFQLSFLCTIHKWDKLPCLIFYVFICSVFFFMANICIVFPTDTTLLPQTFIWSQVCMTAQKYWFRLLQIPCYNVVTVSWGFYGHWII